VLRKQDLRCTGVFGGLLLMTAIATTGIYQRNKRRSLSTEQANPCRISSLSSDTALLAGYSQLLWLDPLTKDGTTISSVSVNNRFRTAGQASRRPSRTAYDTQFLGCSRPRLQPHTAAMASPHASRGIAIRGLASRRRRRLYKRARSSPLLLHGLYSGSLLIVSQETSQITS